MKTILAIDGGGIRGIIPALLLQEIEKRTTLYIPDLFDVIAGSSTGGILAATVSIPYKHTKKPKYTTNDIVKFYYEFGQEIFKRSLYHKIISGWGLWGPKYPLTGMTNVINRLIDNIKISEALTDLVITSYDLEKAEPYVISSFNPDHREAYLRGAIQGTSSVPSYFSPYRTKIKDRVLSLVDGSAFAINPALWGYVESVGDGEEVLMISLGTGETDLNFSYKKSKKWGLLQWLLTLKGVEMVFDGMADSVCQSVEKAIGQHKRGKYYRLQLKLPKHLAKFDNVSDANVTQLAEQANKFIKENDELINEICRYLILAHVRRKRKGNV